MNFEKLPTPKRLPKSIIDSSKLICTAYEFAKKLHNGRKRRGENEFNHIQRVAYHTYISTRHLTICEISVCAAFLHDAVEDGLTTFDVISKTFGVKIASLCRYLTKKNSYYEYVRRMSLIKDLEKRMAVIFVKNSDLTDNLINLEEGHRKDKYLFAKGYLFNVLADILSSDRRSDFLVPFGVCPIKGIKL